MVVVILNEIVLDLEATYPSFVFPVDSTVCSVRLESRQLPKRLPLSLDALFLFCNCQHQIAKPRSDNWRKFFVVALSMSIASISFAIWCYRNVRIEYLWWLAMDGIIVYGLDWFVLHIMIKLSWWPQRRQPSSIHVLLKFGLGPHDFFLTFILLFFSH